MWQDLQPNPGRLGGTLRLVLATVLTLLTVLILQTPYASLALYFVFFVGRESPSVSLRSLLTLVPMIAAVIAELGIVIMTDNEPMARALGVAAVGFLAGLFTVATTLPALGSTWAFLFVTLIAFWETPFACHPPGYNFALDHQCPFDTNFVVNRRGIHIWHA
jgi:multidrug resistance protein MdtO